MAKKEKPVMGKVLITVGLIIKIAQIICVAAGISEMGNAVWTAISAAFLVGGPLVLGMEKKRKTAIFANIAALGALLSLVGTGNRILIIISLFAMFISFAFMMFSMGRKARSFGAVILLLTAVLLLCVIKVFSVPSILGTILLVAIYAAICAGVLAG